MKENKKKDKLLFGTHCVILDVKSEGRALEILCQFQFPKKTIFKFS